MSTGILPPTKEYVDSMGLALRRGDLVGMPTETVYGLAANALDAAAVAKIYAAKERPTFDPLIVHVAVPRSRKERDLRVLLEEPGLVDAKGFSAKARERAAALASAFWPGPLTLVLPRGRAIPDLVTSGLDTVGIRMPAHPIAQALLRAAGVPLAAPSANRFGRISPTSAADVVAELEGRLDFVLDGGRCAVGLESTVIEVNADGSLALLRPGGVPVEAIAAVAGIVPEARAGIVEGRAAAAPGMSASHYAPAKPVVLLAAPLAELRALPALGEKRLGLLVVTGPVERAARRFHALGAPNLAAAVSLSPRGDLAEAAGRLFSTLRQFDTKPDVDVIVAEPPDDTGGLSHAIRDRLTRASAHADRSSRS